MAVNTETYTSALDHAQRRNLLSSGWAFVRAWPILPGAIVALMVFTAVFAPLVAPSDSRKQSLADSRHPPVWFGNPELTERDIARGTEKSGLYRLGADELGRDVLTRVVFGARLSLQIVAVALTSGVLVGTLLGLFAGYWGGWIDELIMRLVDFWLALPFILVALVVAIVWGQSLMIMLGLLALLAWSPFVRNIRAEVLTLKELDYVNMARVAGATGTRIMIRHLLPGVFNTIVVIATLRVGSLILAEASLSFLGVGIPPPTPAWGLMVAEGRQWLTTAWWISFFPGLAIFLVVMSSELLRRLAARQARSTSETSQELNRCPALRTTGKCVRPPTRRA